MSSSSDIFMLVSIGGCTFVIKSSKGRSNKVLDGSSCREPAAAASSRLACLGSDDSRSHALASSSSHAFAGDILLMLGMYNSCGSGGVRQGAHDRGGATMDFTRDSGRRS